jgi:alpha-galactosidase
MNSGTPTEQELQAAADWFEQHFPLVHKREGPTVFPFSFKLEGRPPVPAEWSLSTTESASDDGTIVRSITGTNAATGLQVSVEATRFPGFPAVEWILRFRNIGPQDSPLIDDILPLHLSLVPPAEGACVLHWAKGSECRLDDFAPQQTSLTTSASAPQEAALAPGGAVQIGSHGRSSESALPFFNLQTGDHGIIGAIGWTGGWKLDVTRDQEGKLLLQAGMRQTHLKLAPGEEIRSPRLMLLFWQGERLHGHNVLRQFLLKHHSPRPNGDVLLGPICNAVWGENRDVNQIAKAKWWVDNDLPLEYFWIDAGWYGDGKFLENSTVFNSEWGQHAGNWWPNKGPYPNGLKPVGDALRELGLGFVLWFEPERLREGTYFTREHPEWLLGPIGGNYLFNLGIPEARRAMTDLLSGIIEEAGVTCYRQDFNMRPDPFWEAADAPDRLGISEIKHIEGLYAMWDELLARHPGLIIDNCSSGGRRIDLEMISRSIALWRSDYQCYPDFDVLSQQTQLQGLAPWVPLSTGCCDRWNDYAFRSALGTGMVLTTNLYETEPVDFAPQDWLRERMNEARLLRPYFYGDFYPLLSFSLATDLWAASQWHRPDLGEGCVLAFRRQDSPIAMIEAKLQGLADAAQYEVRDLDGGEAWTTSGAALGAGVKIAIEDQPGTRVLIYRKV